jgi:hypothetical protein
VPGGKANAVPDKKYAGFAVAFCLQKVSPANSRCKRRLSVRWNLEEQEKTLMPKRMAFETQGVAMRTKTDASALVLLS